MAPEVALGKPYNGAADVYGERRHTPAKCTRSHLPVVAVTGLLLWAVADAGLVASLVAFRDRQRLQRTW